MKYWLAILLSASLSSCCFKDVDNQCPYELHPETISGNIYSTQLGKVKMPDGEECIIEEIIKVETITNRRLCNTFNVNVLYDNEHKCNFCPLLRMPLARRVVCPSGKNSTVTVEQNGKFGESIK